MKNFVLLSLLLSTSAFASTSDPVYMMVRQQGQSVDIGGSDEKLLFQALRSAAQNAVNECTRDYQGVPAQQICITDRETGPILGSRKGAGVRKAKIWIRMYCRTSKENASSWSSLWNERDGTNFSNCIERIPTRDILR